MHRFGGFFMAFTAADLASIEAAIVAFGTGKTVETVSVAGKSITYTANRLDDLLRLRALVARELGQLPTTVYAKNAGRSRT